MAIAALVVSVISLIVAALTAGYNSRSAVATESSANSSDRSADAAKDAAQQARRVADAEVGRDHLMYEPQQNGQYVLEGGNLYYEFQLPHRYAMAARVSARGGAVHNDVGLAQRSIDGTWRVFIDAWAGDRTAAQWESLTIRFWPPQEEQGKPAPWACQCDRESAQSDGPGHWQWDRGIPQGSAQIVERRSHA